MAVRVAGATADDQAMYLRSALINGTSAWGQTRPEHAPRTQREDLRPEGSLMPLNAQVHTPHSRLDQGLRSVDRGDQISPPLMTSRPEMSRDHIPLQLGPEPDEGCPLSRGNRPALRAQARGHPQRRAAQARVFGPQPQWQGARHR